MKLLHIRQKILNGGSAHRKASTYTGENAENGRHTSVPRAEFEYAAVTYFCRRSNRDPLFNWTSPETLGPDIAEESPYLKRVRPSK